MVEKFRTRAFCIPNCPGIYCQKVGNYVNVIIIVHCSLCEYYTYRQTLHIQSLIYACTLPVWGSQITLHTCVKINNLRPYMTLGIQNNRHVTHWRDKNQINHCQSCLRSFVSILTLSSWNYKLNQHFWLCGMPFCVLVTHRESAKPRFCPASYGLIFERGNPRTFKRKNPIPQLQFPFCRTP